MRSGAPVAVIGPPKAKLLSGERFRALIAAAPSADEDFAADVRAARTAIGPPDTAWLDRQRGSGVGEEGVAQPGPRGSPGSFRTPIRVHN